MLSKNYQHLAHQYKITPISDTRGTRQCRCGNIYEVKFADIKRGWGRSCSKSCAGITRERRLKGTRVRYTDHPLDFGGWAENT